MKAPKLDRVPWGVVLSATAIWLGWQIVQAPLIQRAPPALAVRVAPSSPQVLSRAAEQAFAQGRYEDAEVLARSALAKAPFDVRALRVAGMSLDREGRSEQANEAVTLAGNWSLRDDPSHAWLVERRLRTGDIGQAMAHADTLVRRREDIQPTVFSLFTRAAADPRGFSALAALLGERPPWLRNFFARLYETAEGRGLASNLAVAMRRGGKPLPEDELSLLYYALLTGRQDAALALVRSHTEPTSTLRPLSGGDFETNPGVLPFAWRLSDQPGLLSSIEEGPAGGRSLWISYEGLGATGLIDRLISLPVGDYQFQASRKVETAMDGGDFAWTITCGSGSSSRLERGPVRRRAAARSGWTQEIIAFRVPENCPVQWIWIDAVPTDRSTPRSAWFDDVAIVRTGRARGVSSREAE